MPLHLYCKFTATKTFFRIHKNLEFGWSGTYKNVYYSTSHMRYWSNIRDHLGFKEEELDTCQETVEQRNFSINTKSMDENNSPKHGELNIYTDGSKMSENRVGAAYVFYEVHKKVQEEKFRLPAHSTVFQAEIKAILEAAAALNDTPKYKFVRFFVDSQAAIKALQAREITSKLVLNTVNELNKAGINRNIMLNWTKAHTGTTGNEMADSLAKQGGKLELIEDVAIPKIELTGKIKEFFNTLWENEWAEYKGAPMTKCFYSKPDDIQSKYVIKLGRLDLSRFIKIITGHNGLFYFKSRIDKEINAVCRFCLLADETFYHLATECPRQRGNQIEIFLDKLPYTNTEWSVRDLLHFSTQPGIREALDGETGLHLYGEDHNWFSDDDDTTEDEHPAKRRRRERGPQL